MVKCTSGVSVYAIVSVSLYPNRPLCPPTDRTLIGRFELFERFAIVVPIYSEDGGVLRISSDADGDASSSLGEDATVIQELGS